MAVTGPRLPRSSSHPLGCSPLAGCRLANLRPSLQERRGAITGDMVSRDPGNSTGGSVPSPISFSQVDSCSPPAKCLPANNGERRQCELTPCQETPGMVSFPNAGSSAGPQKTTSAPAGAEVIFRFQSHRGRASIRSGSTLGIVPKRQREPVRAS